MAKETVAETMPHTQSVTDTLIGNILNMQPLALPTPAHQTREQLQTKSIAGLWSIHTRMVSTLRMLS